MLINLLIKYNNSDGLFQFLSGCMINVLFILICIFVTMCGNLWEKISGFRKEFDVDCNFPWIENSGRTKSFVIFLGVAVVMLIVFVMVDAAIDGLVQLIWKYVITILVAFIITCIAMQIYIIFRKHNNSGFIIGIIRGIYKVILGLCILVCIPAICLLEAINIYLRTKDIKDDFFLYAIISVLFELFGLALFWGINGGIICILVKCIEKYPDIEIELYAFKLFIWLVLILTYNLEYIKYVTKIMMLAVLVIILCIATFFPSVLEKVIHDDMSYIQSIQSIVINVVSVFSIIFLFIDKRGSWLMDMCKIKEKAHSDVNQSEEVLKELGD